MIIYISIDDAIKTQKFTIEKSGGGIYGEKDINLLDSVLNHIQNDDYYPSFEDKLAHLFWGCCKFHTFTDGNKRIALSLSTQFLLINGYLIIAQRFMRDMENISYHVASGNIDKDLLLDIIKSLFTGTFDTDEGLKLRIYNSIS